MLPVVVVNVVVAVVFTVFLARYRLVLTRSYELHS